MTTFERLPWHRPRVVTVVETGPFLSYQLVTTIVGRLLIAGTPIVSITKTPRYDPATLVDAIVRQEGKRYSFNSAELWTHARKVDGPLRAAMVNLKSCQQLGKALEKISKSNKSFDGFAIERQGKDKYGAYYRRVYRY
jgi:hypothetical protein